MRGWDPQCNQGVPTMLEQQPTQVTVCGDPGEMQGDIPSCVGWFLPSAGRNVKEKKKIPRDWFLAL